MSPARMVQLCRFSFYDGGSATILLSCYFMRQILCIEVVLPLECGGYVLPSIMYHQIPMHFGSRFGALVAKSWCQLWLLVRCHRRKNSRIIFASVQYLDMRLDQRNPYKHTQNYRAPTPTSILLLLWIRI